mmetsp:Transcript_89278/g.276342  ORF Transcript_89278/g.276342 Transcript_89278/m.276342 type:complete len:208 (+) Transcript_89278:779-1402(+)
MIPTSGFWRGRPSRTLTSRTSVTQRRTACRVPRRFCRLEAGVACRPSRPPPRRAQAPAAAPSASAAGRTRRRQRGRRQARRSAPQVPPPGHPVPLVTTAAVACRTSGSGAKAEEALQRVLQVALLRLARPRVSMMRALAASALAVAALQSMQRTTRTAPCCRPSAASRGSGTARQQASGRSSRRARRSPACRCTAPTPRRPMGLAAC